MQMSTDTGSKLDSCRLSITHTRSFQSVILLGNFVAHG
jgi:hypothetical protein